MPTIISTQKKMEIDGRVYPIIEISFIGLEGIQRTYYLDLGDGRCMYLGNNLPEVDVIERYLEKANSRGRYV